MCTKSVTRVLELQSTQGLGKGKAETERNENKRGDNKYQPMNRHTTVIALVCHNRSRKCVKPAIMHHTHNTTYITTT